jgi:hypothetical protein
VGNVALFAAAATHDAVSHPRPVLDNLLDILFWPSEAFAMIFTPSGHDFAQLVGMPLLAFAFSILFYGFVGWVILSLPDWWRNRPWNSQNDQDWF